ncbi:MAG: hypothetical protein ACOVVK_11710 [Elsteraceae bacterium]
MEHMESKMQDQYDAWDLQAAEHRLTAVIQERDAALAKLAEIKEYCILPDIDEPIEDMYDAARIDTVRDILAIINRPAAQADEGVKG